MGRCVAGSCPKTISFWLDRIRTNGFGPGNHLLRYALSFPKNGAGSSRIGVARVILAIDRAMYAEPQRLGTAQLIRMTRCHGMRTLSTRATRATLVLAILASALVPCSRAQNHTTAELKELAKEKEVKQEELVNLEKETARALRSNNGALFRRIYGDDFV